MKTLLTLSSSLLLAASMSATIITFDEGGLVPGQIITNQYSGVSISATGGTGHAVLFDSEATSGSRDWDLTRKSGNGKNNNKPQDTVWDGDANGVGNLANNTILNNLLIVQESGNGSPNNNIYATPDDNVGSTITFNFAAAIFNFGFDFVDIEGTESLSVIFKKAGSFVSSFTAADLSTGEVFGNNTINTTDLKSLAGLGVDQVVFDIRGSGAIDNVRFNVSDSGTTLALLGAGLLGLVGARRRFNK